MNVFQVLLCEQRDSLSAKVSLQCSPQVSCVHTELWQDASREMRSLGLDSSCDVGFALCVTGQTKACQVPSVNLSAHASPLLEWHEYLIGQTSSAKYGSVFHVWHIYAYRQGRVFARLGLSPRLTMAPDTWAGKVHIAGCIQREGQSGHHPCSITPSTQSRTPLLSHLGHGAQTNPLALCVRG